MIEALKKMLREPNKAVPPIRIAPDALTYKEVDAAMLKWYRRVIVQPAVERMKARGGVTWEADARRLLDDSFATLFSEIKYAKPTGLAALARKVKADGCDDPGVLLVAAKIDRLAEVDWRFISDCSTLSNKGWDADPKTPEVLRYLTDLNMRWAIGESGRKKEHDALETKAILRLPRVLEDGSFLPDEMGAFLKSTQLVSATMQRQGERVRDFSMKLAAPKWVQYYLLGIAEVDIAWKARGEGWASTVTDDGWKVFSEHLAKAREALVASWRENPKSPLAATKMITVVMAGAGRAGETERVWFDRAIAAQCDYRPAYSAIEWAYRPRWCGSYELMLAFGRACVGTKRYDLKIPLRFTAVCSEIAGELGDWHDFYRRAEVAGPLMELSEGMVKQSATPQDRKFHLSNLVVNAWLTGNNKQAAATLAELGGTLDSVAARRLSAHRVSKAQMLDEIALTGSPVEADFQRANALYKGGKLAEAEVIFRKIEPSTPGTAVERVKERLLLIGIERKLEKGEWARLPVDPKLQGWLNRGGKWSGTEDGVLVNTGTDAAGKIIHLARVGPDFEMKVEFSVEAKEKCCRRCELCFGWHDGFQEPYNTVGYGQPGKFPAETSLRGSNVSSHGKPVKGIPYQEKNLLYLRSSGGKLTFTVNGKPAYTDYQSEDMNFGPADAHVGIGSYRWCRMDTTYIKNVEVRRIIPSGDRVIDK